MRTLWFCEIDPFCQRVLAQHWPDLLRVPDIRSVRAGTVPAVDVVCGGFPCQDVSVAGRGAGIDGSRSGLWAEMVRVVRDLRPRYVIVENVPGLLARGLGRVVGDLAASGYDAEWDCLPASAFGAPHIRDRVWIVAYTGGDTVRLEPGRLGGTNGAGPSVAGHDGSSWSVADADREGQLQPGGPESTQQRRSGDSSRERGVVADADELGREEGLREPAGPGERTGAGDALGTGELQDADGGAIQPWRVGGRVAQAGGAEWWAVEPPIRRVAHGLPDRLDRCAALGNSLIPQIAEWLGRRILEAEGGVT